MSMPSQFSTQAQNLIKELSSIEEFRRGSVSTFFRKCGKHGCACSNAEHPGHPQTKLTVKEGVKTKSINLSCVDALRVVSKQIQNHERFLAWCRKWIELNEQISDLKLEKILSGLENEGDSLEKKRRRRFSRRSGGKSTSS